MRWIADMGFWAVPVAGILVCGIVEVTKMILSHQERIAKIERGMDPDAPRRQGTS